MKVTTPEMIYKIHDMVLSVRRIKVCEIIKATGISQGTVFSILHEKLNVKEISARWVPRLKYDPLQSINNNLCIQKHG